MLAERRLDRTRFRGVVERRARPVGHDEVDRLGLDVRIDQRALHGTRGAATGRLGRADVERVAGERAPGDLGDRRCTACCGVLGRLDHRDAGGLAEDEAIAVRVEWPRGACRVVVATRQGAHVIQRGERDGQHCALGPTGDDDVGIAVLDEALRLDERLHR